MKKLISAVLTVSMLLALLAGCGGQTAQETTTAPADSLEGTLEDLLNQVVTEQPVEFTGGITNLDLTDTSENGLYMLKNYTGLDSAESITEAAAFEPMMGSIAFSMVMVRVAPEADPQTVAQSMKDGIDPRKWICVEADDLKVTGFGDVVMLIMVSSTLDVTAQSYVDAFAKVAGGSVDFQI